MITDAPQRLGTLLLERGYLSVETLEKALTQQQGSTEGKLIGEAIEDIGDVEEIAGQSPVIRLVNFIIYSAVKEGASDIHIEPADRCLRVRTRLDGRLHKALEVPLHLLGAVTSRIKIMASM